MIFYNLETVSQILIGAVAGGIGGTLVAGLSSKAHTIGVGTGVSTIGGELLAQKTLKASSPFFHQLKVDGYRPGAEIDVPAVTPGPNPQTGMRYRAQ